MKPEWEKIYEDISENNHGIDNFETWAILEYMETKYNLPTLIDKNSPN